MKEVPRGRRPSGGGALLALDDGMPVGLAVEVIPGEVDDDTGV